MLKFSDDETITHCRPLVFAVLVDIDERFSHMMSNNKLKISSNFGSLFQICIQCYKSGVTEEEVTIFGRGV
ncbi:hypothetical protein OUZ56_011776 [Daphnia magna]|uniref:Uncharacterized protein n=1 Tax=Daphnia magna TaxID=35525 RepID=A0ABQ9Z137_9CRUS|nr:hypothetical protein OUZ56_011776 [Daphnia magna]